MQFFSVKQLILLPLLCALSSHQSLASIDERGWLAFGELRGYFEPCGCDPEADLGGVVRQYAFLERERALRPDLVLFNLGNKVAISSAESYKNKHILQSLALMKPNAYLLNELEFLHLIELSSMHLPLLLSNALKPMKSVRRLTVLKDTDIFGYMFRDVLKADLMRADQLLLEQWRKLSKNKKRVLLFSGTQDELSFFHGSKWFDTIISANDTPLDRIVGPEEMVQEDKLMRKPFGVPMVPVGGQGFLRGGILLTSQAPLLKDLLNKRECKPGTLSGSECGQQSLMAVRQVTWLDKSYRGLSKRLDGIEKAYAVSSEARLSSLVGERKSQLKSTLFVGADACKSCHPAAYETWKKSGHAHAWATLETRGKTKDPECISCHVVGFKETGGFVSMKDSPQFANVQCENCHGARKEHIENPKLHAQTGKAADRCVSCHHGSHSSNFVFDQYWPKIMHSLK